MIFQALLASSFLFAAPAPLSTIAKKCKQTYKKNSENICFCITSNLKEKLSAGQLSVLAKAYTDRNARMLATKSQAHKPILDLDYQAHSECAKDAGWKFPIDDMGQPNALED